MGLLAHSHRVDIDSSWLLHCLPCISLANYVATHVTLTHWAYGGYLLHSSCLPYYTANSVNAGNLPSLSLTRAPNTSICWVLLFSRKFPPEAEEWTDIGWINGYSNWEIRVDSRRALRVNPGSSLMNLCHWCKISHRNKGQTSFCSQVQRVLVHHHGESMAEWLSSKMWKPATEAIHMDQTSSGEGGPVQMAARYLFVLLHVLRVVG